MPQKIVIDPVTRVEGHGRVTLHLDEGGRLAESRFHIVEFRGFERFIQGRPYWEAPALVQRLCGICPVSHHLAAAKAVDQLHGLNHEDLSPTAAKVRRLLHYGQVFQSHALHFFYLASPDLLLGPVPAAQRNVVTVAQQHRELAKRGILMRKFGQELIRVIAGKRIHGIAAVIGGIYRALTPPDRDYFLDGKELPTVDTMVQWSREMVDFIRDYHEKNRNWIDQFADFPSGHLGLVGPGGALELYDGRLRAVDSEGRHTLRDEPATRYREFFSEGVEEWTYLKFPFLRHLGRAQGWNRVGPLARLNVCDYIPTPLAEQERQRFLVFAGMRPVNRSLYYHWARLIELLHCAEVMRDLLKDPDLLGEDLLRQGRRQSEGVGVVEAPRGTLIHHYQVDERGEITWCNLIVSTTHNNEAMNRAVREVARAELEAGLPLNEEMLNRIEVAIRAYDPCLSCATHALGQMPLWVSLYDHQGRVLEEYKRTAHG